MANSTLTTNGMDKHTGIVVKKTTGVCTVRIGVQLLTCALASNLRHPETGFNGTKKQKKKAPSHKPAHEGDRRQRADPVAVGDLVQIENVRSGYPLIVNILTRRNWLSRPSAVPMPSARPFEQVIAANVDQIVPVFAAASPPPKWNLLDRYLVAAEAAGISALICLTKLDLVKDANGREKTGLPETIDLYRKIGYPVIQVSALTGEGMPEFEAALIGQISVFVGKSGVGKSTLLNALQPGLALHVNEVSQVTGKGKHTTTHMEMFELENGASIIDTPGVRAFGLWDVMPQELDTFYPEMRPYLGQCRYRLDCTHEDEPGCAVRLAVLSGEIDPRRWKSYLSLRSDL
jgi:ribosome biogenesis GTPase / thiamine phosphate phosphatase